MSAPGSFIVSLDCEGRWGMADLDDYEFIRSEVLTESYEWLLATFAKHDVPVTFAFVGALVSPENDPSADAAARGANPGWFARHDAENDPSGWHEPHLLDLVRDAPQAHEIGCHGFTHAPLNDPAVTDAIVTDEIERWTAAMGVDTVGSLVFPRNYVAHRRTLADLGVAGYREAPFSGAPGLSKKFVPLLRDMNIRQAADRTPVQTVDGMIEIPQTDFLNHRRGIRGAIPVGLVERRWQSAVRSAGADGGTVHMWFHPHNLINNDPMRSAVDTILATVADERDNGRLDVVTQAAFVEAASASA